MPADPSSTDDSVARITNWARQIEFPVEMLVAPSNLGFAGGNNLGLSRLLLDPGVTHFLLLNNDATVAADFFDEIGRALAAAPNAGLLTGTIYKSAEREKVWYAGGREIRSRALIEHLHAPPPGAQPVPTEFVSGCVMLISRRTLNEIGLLADCYFPGYMEDAEYSLRAREAGLPVLYAPHARAFHKIGASAGPASASPFITFASPNLRPASRSRSTRTTRIRYSASRVARWSGTPTATTRIKTNRSRMEHSTTRAVARSTTPSGTASSALRPAT